MQCPHTVLNPQYMSEIQMTLHIRPRASSGAQKLFNGAGGGVWEFQALQAKEMLSCGLTETE